MLGRSVTFGPKSVEKRPQQGNFFELTTPTNHPNQPYHPNLTTWLFMVLSSFKIIDLDVLFRAFLAEVCNFT